MMNRDSLKKVLESAGNALVNNGSNAVNKLRELQTKLQGQNTMDPEVNFICFFLCSVTDDVFFNVTGDFPYDPKYHEVVIEIFRDIGNSLLSMAELKPDAIENYAGCITLVNDYLNGLKKINLLTSYEKIDI